LLVYELNRLMIGLPISSEVNMRQLHKHNRIRQARCHGLQSLAIMIRPLLFVNLAVLLGVMFFFSCSGGASFFFLMILIPLALSFSLLWIALEKVLMHYVIKIVPNTNPTLPFFVLFFLLAIGALALSSCVVVFPCSLFLGDNGYLLVVLKQQLINYAMALAFIRWFLLVRTMPKEISVSA